MTNTEHTSQAELDARDFAREFPTPHALQAIAYCEAGALAWDDVAALFRRSLVTAMRTT